MSELHAQILSYLASCHFSLRQFAQALEAGKEAYKIRPGRSQVCLYHYYVISGGKLVLYCLIKIMLFLYK